MRKNLVEQIRASIEKFGGSRTYTFVRDGRDGDVEDCRTFTDLDRRAREIADRLSEELAPGSRALLLYPDGLEFLEAFLGCLYARVVAVPAPVARYQRSMDRLSGILVDADIRTVLTTQDAVPGITEQIAESGLSRQVTTCLATNVDAIGDATRWQEPDIDADSIAYLQYTSGSTSAPKGVMVTHANLVHNIEAVRTVWEFDERDVMVGWLPHFHDMGLIGMLLMPLYSGANCAYCAPLSFIKRPARWLRMMTTFGATATVAPDFAYDLAVRAVRDEELSILDLSTLRIAASGSEPVRPATWDAFVSRFGSVGFRLDTAAPSYGLAEATLFVSSGLLGRNATIQEIDPEALQQNEVRLVEPGTGRRLCGHGRTEGVELRIVSPDTMDELPDGTVGEIWLRGGSVAEGYWNRPQATEDIFRARTSKGNGPFLRTGDLGFVLVGELFVTGRLKDVIIVQGRNIYPQDIEQVVRDVHPGLRARPGAAFSVDTGREHVVIVQEIRPAQLSDVPLAELAENIRQAVVKAFDVSFPSVVFVDRSVPRTTSGKVQRNATRKLFLAGALVPIHQNLDPAVAAALGGAVIAGRQGSADSDAVLGPRRPA